MLPQRRHRRAANPSGASGRGERGLVKVERSRARGHVASNTLMRPRSPRTLLAAALPPLSPLAFHHLAFFFFRRCAVEVWSRGSPFFLVRTGCRPAPAPIRTGAQVAPPILSCLLDGGDGDCAPSNARAGLALPTAAPSSSRPLAHFLYGLCGESFQRVGWQRSFS